MSAHFFIDIIKNVRKKRQNARLVEHFTTFSQQV